MHKNQHQFRMILVICTITALLFSVQFAWSRVAVQSQTVSGSIIRVRTDQSVHLNNGEFYYPTRTELIDNLRPGLNVTLRYYIDSNKQNFFFECREGLNSLTPSQLPQKKSVKPKL